MDRLIGVGLRVAQSVLGGSALGRSEQFWKRRGDLRPFRILLVPTVGIAPASIDEGVALGIEMKAAVPGGGMRDDALAIEPRLLRCSPGVVASGLDIATIENGELPMMLGALFDISPKSRLAIDETAEAVEIRDASSAPEETTSRRHRRRGGLRPPRAARERRYRRRGRRACLRRCDGTRPEWIETTWRFSSKRENPARAPGWDRRESGMRRAD